jgi:methionyl-tRNA synthetase
VGELYNPCKFRAALAEPLAPPKAPTTCGPRKPQLLRNCQADAQRQPWFQIKEDRDTAATTVYVTQSVHAIDNLKTILSPILPHTTQKLHEYLGCEGQLFGRRHVIEVDEETDSHQALTYDHSDAIGTWIYSQLQPGQALRKPASFFIKLEESAIDKEYKRLGG